MADDTGGTPPPQGPGPFGPPEKALAVILLAGALALSYICVDVLAGGAITRMLSRRDPT